MQSEEGISRVGGRPGERLFDPSYSYRFSPANSTPKVIFPTAEFLVFYCSAGGGGGGRKVFRMSICRRNLQHKGKDQATHIDSTVQTPLEKNTGLKCPHFPHKCGFLLIHKIEMCTPQFQHKHCF